ncbi:MAG: hypothetical protein ACR2PZ_24190 [Pseudomonadales bacterium]
MNSSMQSLGSLSRSVARILFARGSPERIQIAPQTLPLSLLLAALAYGLVHLYLFKLSGAQVALSLFSMISILAMSMAWMTRYVARRRLAQVLVAMLLISALLGLLLTAVGLLPLADRQLWLALPLLLLLLYGLSHCLGYALRCSQWVALLWCVLFAAVVYGLYALLDQQLAQVFAMRSGAMRWA